MIGTQAVRGIPALLTGIWGCMGTAGCRSDDLPSPPPVTAPKQVQQWFTEITPHPVLDLRNDPGADATYFMPQIMGAGAALLDYDGDGYLDLYLVNGPFSTGPGGASSMNRLFRREPDGSYRDVTEASGLGDTGYGMGVAVGDFDNDGDPDVYVTNYGPDALYRNNGNGTFTDVTAAAGAINGRWACSASFVDYDRDGFLDIYVANYVHYPAPRVCADDAGRPEYCGPLASPPTTDVLFHNNGDGTFADVSVTSGIASVAGRGLGVLCEDLDGDGWPDIFVANDGEPNFLWMNNGDGTFTESAVVLGVAVNVFAASEASMGITGGDVDQDGDLDLFMTHLASESNTFYRNDGTGSFDDASAASGLGAPSFRLTGFGTAFLDFDNDGDLDVAVVNGRVKRGQLVDGVDERAALASYAEPNMLFRNNGAGIFANVSTHALAFTRRIEVSRGLAVGDIDNDGDLDLLVSNCNGSARLYRNETPDQGHWLIVRAVDPRLRRDAYGARVTVHVQGRTLLRTVNPGSSYASSSDPRVHFGLGDATEANEIEIRWPDGQVDRFGRFSADQIITLKKVAKAPSGA